MLMHIAVPNEFDNIMGDNGVVYDDMDEMEIRKLWKESYENIDNRTLNFQFLASLKSFFREKGLEFSPILKEIF